MQTFLPYPEFEETARILDYRRLGKQRVEAWQIIRALNGHTRGWVNHPATRMWRGHIDALALYGTAICSEWVRRGYNDTLLPRFTELLRENVAMPPWLGNSDLHLSHRSNLIRKAPDHYRQYWRGTPDDLPYIWPN